MADMTPSAEERARAIEGCDNARVHCFVWAERQRLCEPCKTIASALEAAYRDGADAERAAILAMLPSLRLKLAGAIPVTDRSNLAVDAVLRIIADAIEARQREVTK